MILWVVTVIAIQAESSLLCMAGTTGLEPATSAVTGQRSNQLSYVPLLLFLADLAGLPEADHARG
jgi:hypothetical protein